MSEARRLELLILASDDANADAPRQYHPSPWLWTELAEEAALYVYWYARCHVIAKQAHATKRMRRHAHQHRRRVRKGAAA